MPTPDRTPTSLRIETLEARRVLAATLYVDFGEAFTAAGGLTINDTESADRNGPQVFGEGTTLTSYYDEMGEFIEPNTYPGIDQYVNNIVFELNEFFEPFDVSIQRVSSANLTDVDTLLQATETNDAYIHVGGASSLAGTPNYGAAVFDANNSVDNIGFVFTNNDSYISSPTRTLTYTVAANIARQAAITFGVQTTEASTQVAVGNIMSIAGTDADGNFTTGVASEYFWEFLRSETPLTLVNGVSAGTENTYEVLIDSVGRRPGGPEVFTLTALQDDVTFELVDVDTANFHLNGQSWNNIDISDGMIVRPGPQGDMDPSKTDQFKLRGRSFIASMEDDTIFFSKNMRIFNRHYSTPANLHFEFDNFDDQVLVFTHRYNLSIDTAGGNDSVTVGSQFASGYGIETGDGNDRVIIAEQPSLEVSVDGGAGNNQLEVDHERSIGLWNSTSSGFEFRAYGLYQFRNFHEVIGPANIEYGLGGDGGPPPIRNHSLKTFVNGDEITINDETTAQELIANDAVEVPGDQIFVLSTSHPVTVKGVYVQIASNMDWNLGSTDLIQGNVAVQADHVLISNRTGVARETRVTTGVDVYVTDQGVFTADSHDVHFDGLANAKIEIDRHSSNTIVDIHGSDNNDRFIFPQTGYLSFDGSVTELNLYGHGGVDGFVFGGSRLNLPGDLSRTATYGKADIRVVGGADYDYLNFNDSGFSSVRGIFNESHYRLDDQSVRDVTRGQDSPRFEFAHEQTEHVEFLGGGLVSRYIVDPSPNVFFKIIERESYFRQGDTLRLDGAITGQKGHIIRDGQGNGLYVFGNSPGAEKPVEYESIEQLSESGRLAMASQAGTAPLVSVYDPQTNTHLFDLRPYETGFRGGLQVATGDVNGDSIDDIVVAPGVSRYSRILVYNGIDGSLLTSFFAFTADRPIFAENYTGGVDVAVGNVLGDGKFEIIASTLSGTPDVRIFQQSTPLNFEIQQSYNPFPDSNNKGVRIATSKSNNDSLDEVVSTSLPGGSAQVVIYSHGNESATFNVKEYSFFGYASGYLGGFTASAGDTTGDGIDELFLSGINTGSAKDPFSGQYRIINGITIASTLDPDDLAEPMHIAQPFQRQFTRGVSVTARDLDLDGIVDHVFTSRSDNGNNGLILVHDHTGNYVDHFRIMDQAFSRCVVVG